MTKNDPRKALGKGLHSLLPSRNTAPAAVAPAPTVSEPEEPSRTGVLSLKLEHVAPNPDQPRKDFEQTALLELAMSIARDGIIQPILVRKTGAQEYQIIAGERRWRAAKLAGLTEVPVIVRTATDVEVLELAIIENIQREDLNPIDLAIAFHRMATELGLSHDEIGKKTGKERTTITNAVRLLALPDDLQQLIAAKRLTAGHARALLKFEDEATQREIAQRCMLEGWSVRQIEEFTKPVAIGAKLAKKNNPAPVQDPNVTAAISELERSLGTRVRIVPKGNGRGTIEIEYYSLDDLNRLYEQVVYPKG